MTALSPKERRAIEDLIAAIRAELVELGLSVVEAPRFIPNTDYLNQPFATWLEHAYLPSVEAFLSTGALGGVPPIRIGIAALRHYDYFDRLEGSGPLISACRRLDDRMSRIPGVFAAAPWVLPGSHEER